MADTDTELQYDQRVSLYDNPHENLTIKACRMTRWPSWHHDVIVIQQDTSIVELGLAAAREASEAILRRLDARRAA